MKAENTPPEYGEILELASTLKETDFSQESRSREKLRQQLMNSCLEKNICKESEEVSMNKIFGKYRLNLVLGTAACIAVLVFTIIFPGTIKAMADVTSSISKMFRLGNYSTVIQVEDKVSDKADSSQKQEEEQQKDDTEQTISEETITEKKEVNEKKKESKVELVHFTDIAEAQKSVCFKVLAPEYLPSGYSFKEAEIYKGSDQYITLYFKGTGKDIILMQRIMNKDTAFEFATDGPVEAVEINEAKGVWMEPHTILWEKDEVGYALFCKGFSKEEAVKVACSIK